METLFSVRMKEEIDANAHKGDWNMWSPTKEEWLWEMNHHIAKLQKAIQEGDRQLICEFSADVGNLAEKAFTFYGDPLVCLNCKGKGVFCAATGDGGQSYCDYCNGTGIKNISSFKKD